MKALELLGKRIKQLRELRGYTQERFEEISGVNSRYLSAVERGHKNVTLEVLERIAKGLKVDLFSLFAFESKDDRPSRQSLKKLIDDVPDHKLAQLKSLISIILDIADR